MSFKYKHEYLFKTSGEYLKIADDLNFYRIHYFKIYKINKEPCFLAVKADGLKIYESQGCEQRPTIGLRDRDGKFNRLLSLEC